MRQELRELHPLPLIGLQDSYPVARYADIR
jgi:hypothetical protein